MINFTSFFNELDNDVESIQVILMAYLEEYSDCQTMIMKLFQEQNWPQLFILAHTLKGILAGFGDTETTALLEIIESETKDGGPSNMQNITLLCKLLFFIQSQIEQELLSLNAHD
ncbi:hypothetical protein B6A42_27370 (plasmid) [Vibrio coralliilyticus]|nr:hypothetical protein B6A42_27370 [Vibrio coralliilyticus]